MGVGRSDIDLLLRLRRSGALPIGGAVVEIGAQQLSNGFLAARQCVAELGEAFGVKEPISLPEPSVPKLTHGMKEHLDRDAPWARPFWMWLGYDYAAVDIDESPGSIPLDLNYDEAPAEARGKYVCVTNFGTTEQVANQLNAFKVIHDLAAVGAVMIHNLPAQGMLNHGLVNYNPKFFWMLARSNGYEWLYSNFSSDSAYYELPRNIVSDVARSEENVWQRKREYLFADAGYSVALRKVHDFEFVAPIDVNTGVKTNNKALEERYWTVFKPDAFAKGPGV